MNIAVIVLLLAAAQAPGADDIPATPISRRPPDYPASCMPPPGEAIAPQTVTVTFGVTSRGLTEDVRVRESSDPCFEEAAIAAVRAWKYEPRRVRGERTAQADLEVTFTFVLEEPTSVADFDASPLVRVPPPYPERCWPRADAREMVFVEFDVTPEGATENIRIVDSTNPCFNKSAERAVAKWKYRPKLIDGKPAPRTGVQTQITFEQVGSGRQSPQYKYRMEVWRKLVRAQRLLRNKENPEKVLSDLAELEDRYGDSFSLVELSAFHQVRAAARIEAKDYRGALDDLRIVQRLGMAGEATEAVGKTIAQLEAIIAAEDAEAASKAEEDADTQQ